MLPTEPEGYVSIIASNYLFPITSLIESLDNISHTEPNEVQASPLNNGYSMALVLLTALMIESAISRTQYMMGLSTPEKPLTFIKGHFPDELENKVEEIFVLRDVIAHNHVWEAEFYWDDKGKMKLVKAELTNGYGDKKYKKVVDSKNRKTKILGLNIFPNRICRADAIKVLKTAYSFLQAIENIDRNYFSVSGQIVKYKGSVMPFTEFMNRIED
jgi:hypothetical protein